MSVERMAELRRELAQAQDGVRLASDAYADAVVRAQVALLQSKGGDIKLVGSSEDARKLAFAEALLADHVCGAAREDLRRTEYELARLSAELEALKDERKARELDLLERQILAAV